MARHGFPDGIAAHLAPWFNFGIADLDMRPALTCLIGVILAIALNKVTSYYTHTSHNPVKSLGPGLSDRPRHERRSGLRGGLREHGGGAVGVATAISLGRVHLGHPSVFVAYGVSLCGIGMLALTGDTLSMDVFGPVADNANGIGEMGYNRDSHNQQLPESHPDRLPPRELEHARQILTDLDATGNTTKAITKGIAIGSAVIAAVSLFASFVAVLVTGSEEKINQLTSKAFEEAAVKLSVRTRTFLSAC